MGARLPYFGAPEEPFGAREDLPPPFGVIEPLADQRGDYTKTEQNVESGLSESSAFWVPGQNTLVSRVGLRPKPEGIGIVGVGSQFKIEWDSFRSVAPANTDGESGTTDYRSGFVRWLFTPLSMALVMRMRGQTAFGDAQPTLAQFAEFYIDSGEGGAPIGSGTDGAFYFTIGSSVDSTEGTGVIRRTTDGLLQFEGLARAGELLQPASAASAGDVTLSTSDQIIIGAFAAGTAHGTYTTWMVTWVVDFDTTVAGAALAVAEAEYRQNGAGAWTKLSGSVTHNISAINRGTKAQVGAISGFAAGTTIEFRVVARRSAAAGTTFARATNTRMTTLAVGA